MYVLTLMWSAYLKKIFYQYQINTFTETSQQMASDEISSRFWSSSVRRGRACGSRKRRLYWIRAVLRFDLWLLKSHTAQQLSWCLATNPHISNHKVPPTTVNTDETENSEGVVFDWKRHPQNKYLIPAFNSQNETIYIHWKYSAASDRFLTWCKERLWKSWLYWIKLWPFTLKIDIELKAVTFNSLIWCASQRDFSCHDSF